MSEWNHTICETCWFKREEDRFPVQLMRDPGDLNVDTCCFCGTVKVTRIWVRQDPKSVQLVCSGEHPEDDDD